MFFVVFFGGGVVFCLFLFCFCFVCLLLFFGLFLGGGGGLKLPTDWNH